MVTIRQLQPADALSIKVLADAHRIELGFNPRQKFEEAAAQRRGFVALVDELIVGFVIFRHRRVDRQTTLSEICVAKTHRVQHIGKSLISELVKECTYMSRDYIQLKCPVDLPANQFYPHLGFVLYETEMGKKRNLNVWRFSISPKPASEI